MGNAALAAAGRGGYLCASLFAARARVYSACATTVSTPPALTLGAVAVAALLIAPRGIWPFIREPFGIERLSISRKLAGMAAATKTAAITPAAASNPEHV